MPRTHARWLHAGQTGHGAAYSQSGLCVLTARRALLIFLRCQFMVIFYVPNIKTQPTPLHTPSPHAWTASQPNQIRSKLPGDFVICFWLLYPRLSLSIRPSIHSSHSVSLLTPTKRLISPSQCVVASPGAAVPRHSESPRHVESAQSSNFSLGQVPTNAASTHSFVEANVLNTF